MTQRLIASSTLASILALGLASAASAHEAANEGGKEKCYGIAKAGQNDCANLSGTHSCAGQASTDKDPAEWKFVTKGTCVALGGLSAAEANKKVEARK